jgi:hypothetical protein
MQEITVTIAADGSVKVGTKGFKGAACLKATEILERALGKKGAELKTPEYFERQEATHGR